MSRETCFHCGEPIVGDRDITLDIDGLAQRFCCQGCRAVCQLIVDENLAGFYQHRTANPTPPRELTAPEIEQLRLYDHPVVKAGFVEPHPAAQEQPTECEAQLLIEGISCAACIWLLEHHMMSQPGVRLFSVNHSTQRARLVWVPHETALSDLLISVAALGYGARPYQPDEAESRLQRQKRSALIRLCVAGAGAMQSMMLAVPLYFGLIDGVSDDLIQFFRWVSLLVATPVVFYSARPFFSNTLRDLRTRHLTMDVPVALAIGLAYLASAWVTLLGGAEVYFESVCMFTFFLSLGRFIEMQARYRAGLTGAAMGSLPPAIATRRQANELVVVPVHELRMDDLIQVRPGEIVPVDGMIESGYSTLNEAALTGEYLPEERGPGSAAHAGAINGESPLSIRVTQTGNQTRLASILRILDRVQSEKPPVARLADRIAGVFVSRILLIAPVVGIGWWLAGSPLAFDIALSVLVVTCPCALSLATPTALTAATVALRRSGFLPTRGHTLESLNTIDTVVFDKTGTLTEGHLTLVDVTVLGSLSRETCLALAAGLEQFSEHPISKAFDGMRSASVQVNNARNHLAAGLTGEHGGQTVAIGHGAFIARQTGLNVPLDDNPGLCIYLARDQELLARFRLDDTLRPDARETVDALHDKGIRTILLSGDRSGHVQHIARQLGINEVLGQASPEDKLDYLRELEHQGRHVMMVGDGLNDLPVMAGATVSVALGTAADLTQLRADAILLGSQLNRLPVALQTARRARRVIRQNMGWALIYNLCALPLAAAGLVPPWLAALGMSVSSLVVVLNALRLSHRPKPENPPVPAGLAHPAQPDTVI